MDLTRAAISRNPTARERWTAFYRLYRLCSRNPLDEQSYLAFLVCVVRGREAERFHECVTAMGTSFLEFSYARHPFLRRLHKPKLGPAMEHIYLGESDD